MRNDIRRAFDENTDDAHPALRAAIRARLEGATPGRRTVNRFAGPFAAAAVVLLVLGSAYLLLSQRPPARPQPGGQPIATASPTLIPTQHPEPSTSVSPTPSPETFNCWSVSGGDSSSTANVTDVRVGTAPGYDRFVIQFDGPVPQFSLQPQVSNQFTQDASARVLTLQGSRGLKVVVHSSAMAPDGRQTYPGPQDFSPGYPALKEARNIGDFERVYSWGLGLAGTGCFSPLVLTNADRLVVDVQAP